MLKRILLLIPVIILNACLEESSDKLDKKAFTKIYDNSEFNSSFYAIDMKQTADGGYLILGGKTEIAPGETHVYTPLSAYLLKTDELGNVVRELAVEASHYPIGSLTFINGKYYFFAMDDALVAHLISTDQNAESATEVPVLPMLEKPLAAAANLAKTGLLLLSYDNTTQESVISTVDINGAVGESARFNSGSPESPIDDLVLNHVIRQGRQFPFFVGQQSANTFYFNGFYDHTLSTVFTPLPLPPGSTNFSLISGQQDDAGLSSLAHISGTKFALSTYNLGFTFFGPGRDLTPTPNDPMSTTEIQETSFSFPEVKENTPVKVIRATLNGKNALVYASNTKSGQIGLYVYDEITGTFLSSKYLGYANPFEIAALVQTAEGDVVISGTTYIAGRLPRFCLIKVPKDEIKN